MEPMANISVWFNDHTKSLHFEVTGKHDNARSLCMTILSLATKSLVGSNQEYSVVVSDNAVKN